MKIEIEIAVELPSLGGKQVTREEITEWLEYRLGITGGLSLSNPLVEYDLECDRVWWNEV